MGHWVSRAGVYPTGGLVRASSLTILAPSCDAVTRIDYECPLPSSGEQQDSVKPFCNGFIGYHEYLIILCDKAIMGLIN